MAENNERRRREKRPITLEDVEKHLNQQDAELRRGNLFAILVLGSSLVLVGIAIWVGNAVSYRIGLLGNCSLLWFSGFGIMFWALCRMRVLKLRSIRILLACSISFLFLLILLLLYLFPPPILTSCISLF